MKAGTEAGIAGEGAAAGPLEVEAAAAAPPLEPASSPPACVRASGVKRVREQGVREQGVSVVGPNST